MKRETFSPLQAQQVAAAFSKHGVDYMFIGKSGAILLGYPGTTQDLDIFPRKDIENIIESKRAAGRPRDAIELPQLRAFQKDYEHSR